MRKRVYLLVVSCVPLLAKVRGARPVEIEEAGHLPQVDSLRKYARALPDFIAER